MRYFFSIFILLSLNIQLFGVIDSLRQYLVIEYLFDSDTLTDAGNDTLAFIRDTGPLGLHGKLLGRSASFAPGINGNALSLDDSAHVFAGKAEPELNHPEFTLMAWSKPRSWGNDSKRVEIAERTNIYWMNIRVDTWLFRTGIFDENDTWWYLDGDIQMPLNEWTFTACTYDGSVLRAYINGRPAGEMLIGKGLRIDDKGRPLSIGSREPDNGVGGGSVAAAHWDGLIDEFRVFNKALTAEEIARFMTAGHENSAPPTAPSNLQLQYATTRKAKLQWDDNSTDEKEFMIYYSTDSVAWKAYRPVLADTTSFSCTGLTPGQTVYFHVKAVSGGGISSPSNTVVVNVPVDNSPAPVAVYHFENNTNDSYGSLHGYSMGAIAYTDGKNGLCLDLSSADTMGYVAIPYTTFDAMTINLWMKSNETARGFYDYHQWYNGWGLVDGDIGGSGHDFGLSMLENRAAFGTGKPDRTLVSETAINDGQWHMLTAVIDTTAGEMRLYVDKVLQDSYEMSQNLSRSGIGRLFVGANRTNTGFFKGYIDELTLYNTALSADEIWALDEVYTRFEPAARKLHMALYPNPASWKIHVDLNTTEKSGWLTIVGLQGKQVFKQPLNAGGNTIDITALMPGMYVVIIDDGITKQTQKLTIVR
jgi:hypothetical protein